ncbi:MAG: hypothetical protein ACXVPX_08475 [Actinomycetota bacterium]
MREPNAKCPVCDAPVVAWPEAMLSPAGPMMATVLSDANCAPDADGVSHCLNRLRLDSGSELTVRHNHRMIEVPCLSPGERVLVEPS